jgi:copper transport protein
MAEHRVGWRRWIRVLIVALGAFAATGSVASAHAVVDQITPADGSALPEAPEQVVIDFSEPIIEEFIDVELISSIDDELPRPGAALDPADASRLIVTLPRLDEATFQLRVSARDAADLHEVIARTTFSIGGEAPQPSPPVLAKPLPIESVARWLFIVGLAAILGVFVFRSRWPDVPMARSHLLTPLIWGGLAMIALGRMGVIVSRGLDLDAGIGDTLRAMLVTSDVRRLPFVLLAIGCIAPMAMRRPPMWLDLPLRDGRAVTVRQTLGWAGAAWLVMLTAWGDHSALTGSVEVTTAIAKAMHLWGVALWLGVLGVGLVLNAGRGTLRSAMTAVSRTAVAGAFLTAASGFLLVGRLVVSLTALLTSPYGLLLVAKGALLVVAITIGWRMRTQDAVRRRATFEWVVLGAIAALGAAMATAGPAVESSFLDQTESTTAPVVSVRADDLLVQVQAIPGVPGPNALQVRVNDTRRPAPGEIQRVRVIGSDGTELAAPVVDGNAFFEGVELSSGSTTLAVAVERDGLDDTLVDTDVTTAVPVYRSPVRISSAPIAGPARLIGLILLGVAFMMLLRSHRSRSGSTTRRDEGSVAACSANERASS